MIPAGIETAFCTITLAADAMIEMADDAEDLPVPLQTDFTDGFNNARRAHMLRTCRHHFPSLLRYLYTCYDSAGYLFLLDSGEVVGSYECGEGVWQGDPLGNPCFSMAIFPFMEN